MQLLEPHADLPFFIAFIVVGAMGFLAITLAGYYQKKARRYKRELDSLKRQRRED